MRELIPRRGAADLDPGLALGLVLLDRVASHCNIGSQQSPLNVYLSEVWELVIREAFAPENNLSSVASRKHWSWLASQKG